MGKKTANAETKPQKGISPKDAVIAAVKYFAEVAGYTSGITVEETKKSEDGKHWLVTLGYQEQKPGMFGIPENLKAYKTFTVNAVDGTVVSMSIREV